MSNLEYKYEMTIIQSLSKWFVSLRNNSKELNAAWLPTERSTTYVVKKTKQIE